MLDQNRICTQKYRQSSELFIHSWALLAFLVDLTTHSWVKFAVDYVKYPSKELLSPAASCRCLKNVHQLRNTKPAHQKMDPGRPGHLVPHVHFSEMAKSMQVLLLVQISSSNERLHLKLSLISLIKIAISFESKLKPDQKIHTFNLSRPFGLENMCLFFHPKFKKFLCK